MHKARESPPYNDYGRLEHRLHIQYYLLLRPEDLTSPSSEVPVVNYYILLPSSKTNPERLMSLFKTIDLAHVPEDVRVHVALFENVKNAGFLQQQLLDGNSAFEYAFIDASVVSCTHWQTSHDRWV